MLRIALSVLGGDLVLRVNSYQLGVFSIGLREAIGRNVPFVMVPLEGE